MRLCLAIENGKAKGKRIEIPVDGELIGGRDPSATLRLPDVMVSRQHFRVRVHDDQCEVEDLKSQNGTFLNDSPLTEVTAMRVGDVLRAGDTTLSLLEAESKGLIGKEVAGYRVLERLGAGGMGTVFRATQLSLGREVAFKVLSSRLIEDTTFVDLFFKEARAAGALNHPNIVAVYDVGREKGLYYLSMEYMPKGSVQDRLDLEGKLPWTDAVRVVLDAARGLDYAQRKHIVHRDIKPDNLMVAEDGTVKIADLGLAHSLGDGIDGSEGIIGTPHFISPEQALGKAVDVRSDLYSLGASFYRMVAGRNPFHGRKVRDIIVAQVKEMPLPAQEADPTIPREVSAIIERLMQKDPEDRYATPAELIADVERAFERGGPGAGPSKGLWIGIAAAGLAAAIGGWAIFGGGGEPEPNGGLKPIPVNRGDPTGPAPTGPSGVGTSDPAVAAKQAARKRELDAKAAFLEVQSAKLGEAPRIARYRAVAKEHPKTEYGKLAATAADEIAKRVAVTKAARDGAIRALEQEWTQTQTDVAALVEQSRYAAAHGRVAEFVANHPTIVGVDYRGQASELRSKTETGARDALNALKERAEALAKDEDFEGARNVFGPFVASVADAKSPDAIFTDLVSDVETVRAALTRREHEVVAKRFAAERQRLIDSFVTAFDQAENYAFALALSTLTKARDATKAASYRDRYTMPIDAIQSIIAVRKQFIERGNRRGGLQNKKVPLDRSMVGNETGTLTKVDENDLHIEVSIRGRRSVFKRAWKGYPAPKYLELFSSDRWEMSADDHRGVAWLALLLGRHDIAAHHARSSGDDKVISQIEHECKAQNLLNQLYDAAKAEAWTKVKEHASDLRVDYLDTIAFVRHTNGETPLAQE